MAKSDRPEKGTPEYAAYRKARKERKERREHDRSKSVGNARTESSASASTNSLAVRPPSRAGSEFSYISSVGSAAEAEGGGGGRYRKAEESPDERGLSSGYSVVGGSTGYGASGAVSPVSPISRSGSPGPSSYNNWSQGQYPPYQQHQQHQQQQQHQGQFPFPPPTALAPPAQYGQPAPQPTPQSGYGYPPAGYNVPPAIPPPPPSVYPQVSPSAPPPHDPQFVTPPPGFGAGGGVYPPGETPTQYINPDYYAETQNPTQVSASQPSVEGLPPHPHYAQPYYSGQGGGQFPTPLQIPAPPPPAPYQPVSGGGGGSGGGAGGVGGGSSSSVGAGAAGGLSVTTSQPSKPSKPSKHGFLDSLKIPFSGLSIKPTGSSQSNDLPPPSPSLQPYHGTYQSISPLPSPVLSPSPLFSASGSISIAGHSLNSAFSLGPSAFPPVAAAGGPSLHQTVTAHHAGASSEKTTTATTTASTHSPRPATPPYDPAPHAKALLSALKHTFRPPTGPLIEILPTLSPSQVMDLRREYKVLFKQVNVAKHIKTVFPSSSYGGFGKLAFAVALGPYESEGWFANCWYQRRETRNELLIEALMGKSAEEIRNIKAVFKDAKYLNSLEKVVRNELEGNKFRMAVLMQLEGLRMDEATEVNADGVKKDATRLGDVLERKDARGGETMMVEILVNRSDRWIREMARLYKATYGRDLAKAVRRHSKNLVGETLLHIINGAVDKPLRDAKLLEQAITALVEEGREDLLVSRMVRVHWDVDHLERVKRVYRKKFKVDLAQRVKEVVDGDFEKFLVRMIRG